MKARNRKRRAVLIAGVLIMGLAVMAVVVIIRDRGIGLQDALSRQVNRYLKRSLGSEASVEHMTVGWRNIEVTNLRVPLDQHGSVLVVPRAEAGIRPFDAISAPREFPRALRSLHLHSAYVLIEVPESEQSSNDRQSALTFAVPFELYEALSRFDSLTSLIVDDGRVTIHASGRDIYIARDLNLNVARADSGDLTVTGSGYYLRNERATFSLSGAISPNRHSIYLAALATIPSGLAGFSSSDLRSVSSGGGTASIMLTAKDSIAVVSITSTVNQIEWHRGREALRMPRLHVATSGDTLWLEPLTLESTHGRGYVTGHANVANGQVDLTGELTAWFGDTIRLDFHACGALSEPKITFSSPFVRLSGQELRDITGEATYAGGKLDLAALEFRHESGVGKIQGSLQVDSVLTWTASAQFTLDSSYSERPWRPRFGQIQFDAAGTGTSIAPRAVFLTREGIPLANVVVHREQADWIVDLRDTSGEASTARIVPFHDQWKVTLENGQVMLRALLKSPEHTVDGISTLSGTFEGNSTNGQVALRVSTVADSLNFVQQFLREFNFLGRYVRGTGSQMGISGSWSGLNGQGEPFHGSADLDLDGQLLTVNRLFVDEAGTGSGAIDFAQQQLALEFEVATVNFNRLPLVPGFAKRAQITGTTSGYFSAHGDLRSPEWTASLSVAEGSVLGVPGYWINLDASGKGSRVNLNEFGVGRDIQKILSAEGWLDVRENQIAITAETGSARAEDFLTALIGRQRILSGRLDGSAAISGRLTRPDIETQWRISDGELLNEIHFTTLNMSVQFSVPDQGAPTIRVSELEMGEWGKYFFTGHFESGIKSDSPLRGHMEGEGELLNLVDQLDRSFHSEGSAGNFTLDVGGTLGHPKLMSAALSVDHGRFTYLPASPVSLDMQIDVRVGGSGAVETGKILFRNGDQSLTVSGGVNVALSHPNLRPITLPGIGANIGVLEFRTTPDGIPVRLPGLMKPEWVVQLVSGSGQLNPLTISLRDDSTLNIAGDAEMHNGRMTFPFVGGGGPMRPVTHWLVDRLTEARWDVDVSVGSGNHYDVEVTGLKNSGLFAGLRDSPILSTLADYLDHLSIDAVVDPTDSPLQIRETVADSSFYLRGRLSSSHGRVEYLDQQFRIDYAYSDFDETSVMPVLEGRASTSGMDSLGRRVPVYLTMYVIDRETQTRQRRGRLDDLTFVLEDDAGNPPENVLALLGYEIGTVSGKAQQVVATSVVRAVGRYWLDPIERRLERWTPFDEITIVPAGGRSSSLARQQRQQAARDTLESNSAIRFFTGSQLTVGKYLTEDVFVTYTGELSEDETARQTGRLSLVHLWNLEYRIKPLSPDLVLDFGVEYDEIERKRDESVSLKYSFALEP